MSKNDKPAVLLEYYLKRLKLLTFLREYAPLAAVCQKDRTDYMTYLLRLTERELLDREKRAAERRIKEANFPVVKTIDTFDFKVQPSINEQLVKELMRGEYIDKKENILLIGNPGTGKTHLACALAFTACAQSDLQVHSWIGLHTGVTSLEANGESYRLNKAKQRIKYKQPNKK